MYRKVYELGDILLTAGTNGWTALPEIDLEDATSVWISGCRPAGGSWATGSTPPVEFFGRIGENFTGVKLISENKSDAFYISAKAEVNGVDSTNLNLRTSGVPTGGSLVRLVAVVYYA